MGAVAVISWRAPAAQPPATVQALGRSAAQPEGQKNASLFNDLPDNRYNWVVNIFAPLWQRCIAGATTLSGPLL
jgi:hypothetical protein